MNGGWIYLMLRVEAALLLQPERIREGKRRRAKAALAAIPDVRRQLADPRLSPERRNLINENLARLRQESQDS